MHRTISVTYSGEYYVGESVRYAKQYQNKNQYAFLKTETKQMKLSRTNEPGPFSILSLWTEYRVRTSHLCVYRFLEAYVLELTLVNGPGDRHTVQPDRIDNSLARSQYENVRLGRQVGHLCYKLRGFISNSFLLTLCWNDAASKIS